MKRVTIRTILGLALGCLAVGLLTAAKKSDAGTASLIGTWELVSEKWDDAKEFTPPSKDHQSLKFVTPTHFSWVWVDPKTKKIVNSMGGTYEYDGVKYTENVKFAFAGMGAYVGKKQAFTLKIEGDRWIQSGVLSGGQKLSEIWQRVK
jgi:hypothetical protein